MSGRNKKQKKPDSQRRAEAARKVETARRARTVRRSRPAQARAQAPAPAPPASRHPRWLVLLLRGLFVIGAGYLAATASFVSFFSGVTLLTVEPSRPFSGAALLTGGTLLLPLLLYYGVARLTANSSSLTRTWQGRVRWSLVAYALTVLFTILLDFSLAPFPISAVPAAFIVGKRTFRAALIACVILLCLVLALW